MLEHISNNKVDILRLLRLTNCTVQMHCLFSLKRCNKVKLGLSHDVVHDHSTQDALVLREKSFLSEKPYIFD